MEFERRLMGALSRFVIRHYRWIPVAALGLLALSIVAATNLQVKTQVKDLLPVDNPMVTSYEEIIDAFNGGESVFVLVEGETKEVMAAAATHFVDRLDTDPTARKLIQAVNLRVDRDFVSRWGLLLQDTKSLERTGSTFAEVNLLPLLRSLNDGFEDTYNTQTAEEELSNRRQESETVALYQQMESFFAALHSYLEDPGSQPAATRGRELAELFFYGEPYSFAWDNSMLVFSLVPAMSVLDLDRNVELTDLMRRAAAETEQSYPGVTVSVTGNVPIQADEQTAMGMDMLVPAFVALLVILVLFIFSFRQLRAVFMALAVLVVAVIYNFGFAAITVREITMLTSFMSTLLIGLGVDYGIQIITNFNAFRAEGKPPEEAVELTFQKAGMGTLLAAVTTAIAFFVMALTGSKAFAQFGYLASGGIVLCFLAMILILPSLLLLWGRADLRRSRIPKIEYAFLGRLARLLSRKRIVTLSVGLAATVLLAWTATGLRVEYNFMNLEPQDMPSLVAYNKMARKFELTPSQSMLVADSVEEAHELTEKLEKEPLVADVMSVARFLPTEEQSRERLELIRGLRSTNPRYRPITYQGSTLEELLAEIQRVEWNLTEIGDLSVAGLGEGNRIVLSRNRIIREVLGSEVGAPGKEVFRRLIDLVESNPQHYGRLLTDIDSMFAPAASAVVGQMVSVDRPITVADLPEEYRTTFFSGSQGRNLVTVFPRDGIFEDLEQMRRFSADMARVDPRITGSVQLGLEWTEEAFESSLRAGIYIFIVIIVLLLIEFRSLRWAAAAAFPLFIGMVWMLGLYQLLGLKINPINLTMVPLIIGLAVDFGIHLAHRHRQERDLTMTYNNTGKAVLLSAATTMIGFGSLALIGEFVSIALIGAILFLGIASACLVSFSLLPGLLNERKEVVK